MACREYLGMCWSLSMQSDVCTFASRPVVGKVDMIVELEIKQVLENFSHPQLQLQFESS